MMRSTRRQRRAARHRVGRRGILKHGLPSLLFVPTNFVDYGRLVHGWLPLPGTRSTGHEVASTELNSSVHGAGAVQHAWSPVLLPPVRGGENALPDRYSAKQGAPALLQAEAPAGVATAVACDARHTAQYFAVVGTRYDIEVEITTRWLMDISPRL